MTRQRQYIAIDLKSFYASCECVRMGMDPLTTNLVVADESRTDKTICLAVTPSLKAFGIPGRPRLFEVKQKVAEINALRRQKAPGKTFREKSCNGKALLEDPALELDLIVAPPRMAEYIRCSARIYQIYLKYIAPEDIHVYSVDEVFIDATPYLKTYGMTAHELARTMIDEVLGQTGITATAGIGTNLYLCKVAMDIMAKRCKPDADGVRIAQLDEMSYRKSLWDHRPLTDFWRVGPVYAK
jgi:DNA polymerase V